MYNCYTDSWPLLFVNIYAPYEGDKQKQYYVNDFQILKQLQYWGHVPHPPLSPPMIFNLKVTNKRMYDNITN